VVAAKAEAVKEAALGEVAKGVEALEEVMKGVEAPGEAAKGLEVAEEAAKVVEAPGEVAMAAEIQVEGLVVGSVAAILEVWGSQAVRGATGAG